MSLLRIHPPVLPAPPEPSRDESSRQGSDSTPATGPAPALSGAPLPPPPASPTAHRFFHSPLGRNALLRTGLKPPGAATTARQAAGWSSHDYEDRLLPTAASDGARFVRGDVGPDRPTQEESTRFTKLLASRLATPAYGGRIDASAIKELRASLDSGPPGPANNKDYKRAYHVLTSLEKNDALRSILNSIA